MKGNEQVIQELNSVLLELLTAINQYFLHARMLGDWGFDVLEKRDYAASIDTMKAADTLIGRILFLEGLPNLQQLGKLLIGEDAPEVLRNNLTLENRVRGVMQGAIAACEQAGDFISREHLQTLLEHVEEPLRHVNAGHVPRCGRERHGVHKQPYQEVSHRADPLPTHSRHVHQNLQVLLYIHPHILAEIIV